MLQTESSLQQQLADYYRTVLQIQSGPKITCHALTGKDRPCGNKASKEDVADISNLLEKLVGLSETDNAGDILSSFLRATLCHMHVNDETRRQKLLQKWKKNLQNAQQGKHAAQKTTSATDQGQTTPSDVSHGATKKEENESQEQPLHDIPHISDTASPKIRKADPAKKCDSSQAVQHQFEPFGKPKTRRQINNNVKEWLLSDLNPSDLKHYHSPGYIYTYTFPSSYRANKPLIKIGNTTDVSKRLEAWRNKCGYQPKELYRFTAEHHIRVERLVHAQLYNSRMREKQCPKCGCGHVEWFDVRSSDVTAAMTLWTDWTRRAPYNENGKLAEEWKQKLETVDLDDKHCWSKFVSGKSGE